MDNLMFNDIVNIEYLPSIPEKETTLPSYAKIPFSELSALGVAFSSLPETFRTVTQSVNTEGLYRCVFPDGVMGKLASFKDGSGNLGTIMNQDGIAGQARWIKADSQVVTTTIPYNPTVLFMAMALMSIDKKLDKIEESQKEILCFMKLDKESKIRGDLNTLAEILNNYKYNWDNETYKKSNIGLVQNIKRSASGNIDFYRESINITLIKEDGRHNNKKTSNLLSKIDALFKNYRLSLYIYSFAYFIEVMLTENFDKAFLDNVAEQMEKKSVDYRTLYSECYAQIEEYAKSTVETHLLKGAAAAGKTIGEAVAKIPLLNKSQLDESLLAMGDLLAQKGSKSSENSMERYIENRDSGIQIFIDNVNTVNRLHNRPMEVLFDKENVYYALA